MPLNDIKFAKASDCPDAKKHTSHPVGYVAHEEWADKKMKTHKQERCPTCGFWVIWKPKKKAVA